MYLMIFLLATEDKESSYTIIGTYHDILYKIIVGGAKLFHLFGTSDSQAIRAVPSFFIWGGKLSGVGEGSHQQMQRR